MASKSKKNGAAQKKEVLDGIPLEESDLAMLTASLDDIQNVENKLVEIKKAIVATQEELGNFALDEKQHEGAKMAFQHSLDRLMKVLAKKYDADPDVDYQFDIKLGAMIKKEA